MINLPTLRALKGAPLSIVVALMMANQPVGESWLVSITGYSQNTIRNGCKFLTETQMIQRNGRYQGYVLSHGAEQFPLGMEELRESQKLTLPAVTTTTTFNSKKDVDSEEKAASALKRESKIDPRESKNDSRTVLLYSAGIMEPTASRLLKLPWATQMYIQAHIDKANKENKSVALLIHRIQSHDPMPKNGNGRSPNDYRRSWLGKEC
jgi:predicted transcriptional regulator